MYYENGTGKSLDEMVIEKERQLRREEARKRAQEEMKKREDAHRLQRLSELERVSSTNFDNRGDEENEFYARPNVSGIIRAAKAPKLATIGEYNDAIKAQDEMIDIMHKHRWENASVHTKEEAADAKKLYDTAKEYKANLEIAKAEAMGLGQNGYWEQNSKTYGQGINHAYGNVGEGIKAEQERKQQAQAAANNGIRNAYGNVGEGIKAEQERKVAGYNKGMQDAYGNWNSEVAMLPGQGSRPDDYAVHNIPDETNKQDIYKSLYDKSHYDKISDDGLREELMLKNKAVKMTDSAIRKIEDELLGEGLSNKDKGILNNQTRQLRNDKASLFNVLDKGITLQDENESEIKEAVNEMAQLDADYMQGKVEDSEYDKYVKDYKKKMFDLKAEKTKYSPTGHYLSQNYPIEESWKNYVTFGSGFGGKSTNINSEFLGRLAFMAKEFGTVITIGSGYRTHAEQKAKYSPGGKAAKPGTSWHEFGAAIDCQAEFDPPIYLPGIKGKIETFESIPKGYLEKYGLTRNAYYPKTMPDGTKKKTWEWWHITPIETSASTRPRERKDWALENMYFDGIDEGFE